MPGEKSLNGTARLATRVDTATRSGGSLSHDSSLAKIRKRAKVERSGGTLGSVARKAAVAGAIMGAVDGLRTVLIDHRTNTHHSATPHPWLRQALELTGRSLGVGDPRLWPDAHLEHHAFSDVRLFPFLRISRAINWVEEQKAAGNDLGVDIPSHFFHLDPKVDEGKYSQAQVREIGKLAEQHAKEKLGGLYVPPTEYSQDELQKIFHPTEPDYYYRRYKRMRRGEYTSDQMAALVLGDPHSPLYADKTEKNGVRKVLAWGVWPYFTRTNLSNVHPEIISPHAKNAGEPKNVVPAVVTGVLLPGVVVLLSRVLSNGKLEVRDFGHAATASAVATSTRLTFVGGGSMAVNGWGHSGDNVTPKGMWRAATGREFDIKVRPGGLVSSELKPRGLLTWFIHLLTQDEVFGQGYHHDYPDDPKYTANEGLQGLIEAPVGSVINAIINSGSTLIEPGDNFGLVPGERRPDEPHPATQIIMAERDLQRELNQANADQTSPQGRRKSRVVFWRQ